MKKANKVAAEEEMRAEYDFSEAVRGKHLKRFRESSNVVVLDPDVAESFPNSESVNEALRSLVTVARRSARVERRGGPKKRARKRPRQAGSSVSGRRGGSGS